MRTFPVGTRRISWFGLFFLATATITMPVGAQSQERGANQELTFSLGGIPGQTRSFQGSAGTAQVSADRSFGINYGHRFLGAKIAASSPDRSNCHRAAELCVALPHSRIAAEIPSRFAAFSVGCHWWWLWSLSAVRAALEWPKHDE